MDCIKTMKCLLSCVWPMESNTKRCIEEQWTNVLMNIDIGLRASTCNAMMDFVCDLKKACEEDKLSLVRMLHETMLQMQQSQQPQQQSQVVPCTVPVCFVSALHTSAKHGHLELVKYFLDIAPPQHGYYVPFVSALKAACLFNHVEVVKHLCQYMASHSMSIDGDNDGLKFVFVCLCKDEMFCDMVELMHREFNMSNAVLNNALRSAIEADNTDMVRTLKRIGATMEVEEVEEADVEEVEEVDVDVQMDDISCTRTRARASTVGFV